MFQGKFMCLSQLLSIWNDLAFSSGCQGADFCCAYFEDSVLGISQPYVYLRGVLECVFKCPGKQLSNMVSPANLTTRMRTASKFCAHIRAASREIFVLDLKSYESSGIIGPWPECQLTPTATTRQQPSLLSWVPRPIRAGKISR